MYPEGQDPNKNQYKSDIDMTYIFNRQILRVLATADTPLYESAIDGLQMMLPLDSRIKIEQNADSWSEPKITWTFKKWTMQRQGTKTNPRCWDEAHYEIVDASQRSGIIDPETKEINWKHEDIVSPTKTEEGTHVDYNKLLDCILAEAELIEILWPQYKKNKVAFVNPSPEYKNPTRGPQ